MMSRSDRGAGLRIQGPHAAPSQLEDAHGVASANSMALDRRVVEGNRSMSGRAPVFSLDQFERARSMVDRLRRPRKSILSRPRSSMACISNWVTTSAPSPSAVWGRCR